MTITITHPKVNNVPAWTQAQLNAAIARGQFAPGTTINDITLSADWNTPFNTSMATNKLIGRGTAGTGAFEEITLGTGLALTGTTLDTSGVVPDSAYGSGWDGSTLAPTRNAVYDKIQALQFIETIPLSDETTPITTGTTVMNWVSPVAGTITLPVIYVKTAPTGATIIVDIKKNGTTIFSTKLSIDASETSSSTAASAGVLSVTTVAVGDIFTWNIDQVGSTIAGVALKCYFPITRTA